MGFRRRTAKSAAPPFAVLSELEVGQKALFFMALLCVSQQGEFKNTTKNFFGKSTCQKHFAKKLRGKKTFFLLFSPSIFLKRAFGVSLRDACCTLCAVHCVLAPVLCPLCSISSSSGLRSRQPPPPPPFAVRRRNPNSSHQMLSSLRANRIVLRWTSFG